MSTRFPSASDRTAILEALAQLQIGNVFQWRKIEIPKALFTLQGASTASWNDVRGYRFTLSFTLIGPVPVGRSICKLDIMQLEGGGEPGSANAGGLFGDYEYAITYLNNTTGNRSNAGPTTVTASGLRRGFVALTGIPVSADPQVTHVELWRTLGNGVQKFFLDKVANGVTVYDDDIADTTALASIGSTLSSIVLPTDNDPPDADFEDFIIDRTTAFWVPEGTGKRGRIYFSPIGRPESKKGFIQVSSDADPLQAIALWAGARWAYSLERVFRIDGEDPYVALPIGGVPGVRAAQRRTVVPTPFGIIWQANDGVRIFDGQQSFLIGSEPLGRVFRGGSGEDISSFEGTVATFANDEYIVSNGAQCLALHVLKQTWRNVSFTDVTALLYEPDTGATVAGRGAGTQVIEDEAAVNDAGVAIPFEVESPAVDFPTDRVLRVEAVYVDIGPNSQTITPTIVHRDGTLALSTITGSGRAWFQQDVDRLFLQPSLRLGGSINNRVTLYGAEFDVEEVNLHVAIANAQHTAKVVPGRSADLTAALLWDITPGEDILDQLNTIYFLERLEFETDTEGTVLTPKVHYENTTQTLATFSTTSRSFSSYTVNRLGPVTRIELAGNFTGDVKVYSVKMTLRPVWLDVVNIGGGQRIRLAGRAPDPTSKIIFDMDPTVRDLAQETGLLVVDRLTIEADTNSVTLSSAILGTDGVSITGPSLTNANRAFASTDIDRLIRPTAVELSINWVTSGAALFGAELVLRPFPLHISVQQ